MRVMAFLALAACAPTPFQTHASQVADPTARARYAALAWIDGEYDHDYAGYNAFRADMLDVDEAALAAALSDEPKNVAAWRGMVEVRPSRAHPYSCFRHSASS